MSQNDNNNESQVTRLLLEWQAGSSSAGAELGVFVHAELNKIARGFMHSERASHTLQPTALVNEAWMRMVGVDSPIVDRQHFYALAARMMRRILVDHARARSREKRGQDLAAITLHESLVAGDDGSIDLLELDEVLQRLAAHDQRLCDAVELIYFGGLSYSEAAASLGVSRSTLGEELKFAKAWLRAALQGGANSGGQLDGSD